MLWLAFLWVCGLRYTITIAKKIPLRFKDFFLASGALLSIMLFILIITNDVIYRLWKKQRTSILLVVWICIFISIPVIERLNEIVISASIESMVKIYNRIKYYIWESIFDTYYLLFAMTPIVFIEWYAKDQLMYFLGMWK